MEDHNGVNEELVEWISKPGNKDLLETLQLMKKADTGGDWFEDLTQTELDSVERGRQNIQDGDTVSSQEFWKKHG
ncbi:MAG: hypothetical protein U5K71_09900 [Gracilimonas sp.]|nr:hypothetical protein [Gracilimonas sp.]